MWDYPGSRHRVAGRARLEPLDHYVRSRIGPASPMGVYTVSPLLRAFRSIDKSHCITLNFFVVPWCQPYHKVDWRTGNGGRRRWGMAMVEVIPAQPLMGFPPPDAKLETNVKDFHPVLTRGCECKTHLALLVPEFRPWKARF